MTIEWELFQEVNNENKLKLGKYFSRISRYIESGLNPEWLYSAKANMILIQLIQEKGKSFLY